MAAVSCERIGGILVARMERGKANALNGSMVEELHATLDLAAREDEIRGIVLASNCPGFFSAGFDINEVFRFDRETMTLFFARFVDLYESLLLLPKPSVAAIEGHAFGGGAILCLCCDLRIMAEGDFGIALNQIDTGTVLPPGLTQTVIQMLGSSAARHLLLAGEPVVPERARELGIVSEVEAADRVLERAAERCRTLAAKPPLTFALTKRSIRELTRTAFSRGDRYYLGEFIEQWFSPEAEMCREAILESFTARKAGN
jgi:Delta3-Delta2-enoyl-CoA isomerase